ncbi:MAG: protein phosphatase 2C domain-containing protein [Rudanella sp.]|nr:protein phosphatase 2C domain-containing protein [Rudanella sp.]
MPQTDWIYAFASVRGNGHIAEDIPCQDAHRVEHYENFTIAVICDGAGSCENSDKGANQVADSCLIHFGKRIIESGWADVLPAETIWQETAKQTLRLIRDDTEKFAQSEDLSFKSISCTVIVVVSLPGGLLVTHIGDGRAGYCTANGDWLSALAPFRGEEVNQTVFITSDIWEEPTINHYLESRVIPGPVTAFALLSDGCEKVSFEVNLYNKETERFYDPNLPYSPFFRPLQKILLTLHEQQKTQEEINMLWAGFLTNGLERLQLETDDKTMILAVRLPDATPSMETDHAEPNTTH